MSDTNAQDNDDVAGVSAPVLTTVDEVFEDWFGRYINDSIISRNTPTYNYLVARLPLLIAAVKGVK